MASSLASQSSPMSSVDPNMRKFNRRARILSLDGGGVRGLVTLQILIALEKKIKIIDPAQSIRTVFDLICGTSTGGILAMTLVATDMPLSEINKLYKRLPGEVFTGWNWWNTLKVGVGSAFLQNTAKYSPKNLERLIDETFGKGKTLAECTNKTNPALRGFVTSTRIDKENPEAFLFRNYVGDEIRNADVHRMCGSFARSDLSVTLKEALRASSAAPSFFPSIVLPTNDASGEEKFGTFVDGGFLVNNPVEVAVAEAYEMWPTRGVGTIVSLGTGEALNESGFEKRSNLNFALTALELATEAHRASNRMETVSKIVRLMAINEVRAGLDEIDLNGDGKISAEEFYHYLSKFGIHKGIKSIPESMSSFGDENQEMPASRANLRELFKLFKEELDTYHDFPEYTRVNVPHTVNGRRIDLGKITLDTTDEDELTRMVHETNEWIKTDDAQAKLDRLAERLTHSAQKSHELVRALTTSPQHGAGAPGFWRQTTTESTISSVDISESARIAGGLPIDTINERN